MRPAFLSGSSAYYPASSRPGPELREGQTSSTCALRAPYVRLASTAAGAPAREKRERRPHEPLREAGGGAADVMPQRDRDQAIGRAQHAPALGEVERFDRFVEGEPADPALLERRRAAGVSHQKVRDGDPIPFLLLLDASQAPDRPRAHTRLLGDLAQRGDGGGLSFLHMPLRKDPAVARSGGFDEEVAWPFARQPEDDGSSVRRAAQCGGSSAARCASSQRGSSSSASENALRNATRRPRITLTERRSHARRSALGAPAMAVSSITAIESASWTSPSTSWNRDALRYSRRISLPSMRENGSIA